ncbi:MAG: ribosome small subunit-dependent GTPase A [Oscillospiraceae bacterium]|jgi:ribosome biogenesis GTPase|nr:ribosome small subunit-dependent GTPase A [Oscillospiraceae bacterium]
MSDAMTGRLIRGVGGLYTARDANGQEYVLRARGRFRREKTTPLPGDRVQFTPGEGEIHGWLDEILPRVSQSLRPPVANITLEVAVIAPEPTPDLLLIDRLLVHAARSGFRTLLCVNKCDLDRDLAGQVQAQYAAAGIEVLAVSAATGEGLEALRERMTGELCCMAGQSAVGKSTLLNALLGARLLTGDVSEKIRRGRHTTRHCELYEMGGLAVLDTPGFSLLSLDGGLEPEQLQNWYPDYRDLAADCRFAPCVHDREPGCAVRAAVASGALDARRHARYLALLEEVRLAWKGRFG